MTYYIDPGTSKGCAVACFGARSNAWAATLQGLGFWHTRDGFTGWWGSQAGACGSVWEMPQLYPSRGRDKASTITAKANDLIALAAAGSACANVLSWGRGGVRSVLPREWKRQLAKPQHHAHALTLLQPQELALVVEAYGKPEAALRDYVRAGCLHVARNPGKGLAKYSAKITDLLDAVTLGLTEEGRLVL